MGRTKRNPLEVPGTPIRITRAVTKRFNYMLMNGNGIGPLPLEIAVQCLAWIAPSSAFPLARVSSAWRFMILNTQSYAAATLSIFLGPPTSPFVLDTPSLHKLYLCFLNGPAGFQEFFARKYLSNMAKMDWHVCECHPWITNRQKGRIPKSIFSVTTLTSVSLRGCFREGLIPPEIGLMSALETLDLASNLLFGPIPSELGQLTSLKVLILSSNNFTGALPASLGCLAALEVFVICTTGISGDLPAALGNCGNLRVVCICCNPRLNGRIPPEWSRAQKLKEILLHNNNLTGSIPREWGLLGNLETLRLRHNRLEGQVPEEFSRMSLLQVCDLRQNPGLSCEVSIPGLELDELDFLR